MIDKNRKGDIFMKKNRYAVSLYFICPLLFIGIVFAVLFGCSEKPEQAKVSQESVSEKKVVAEPPKVGESVPNQTLSDGGAKGLDIPLKQVGSSTQEGLAFPDVINMDNKAYAEHTKGIVLFTHKKRLMGVGPRKHSDIIEKTSKFWVKYGLKRAFWGSKIHF